MSVHHAERIWCRDGSRAELGGPVHSELEGELFGLPVEQLRVLGQLVGELHPKGLPRLWSIHQHVEGLQDWGERSDPDIRTESKNPGKKVVVPSLPHAPPPPPKCHAHSVGETPTPPPQEGPCRRMALQPHPRPLTIFADDAQSPAWLYQQFSN